MNAQLVPVVRKPEEFSDHNAAYPHLRGIYFDAVDMAAAAPDSLAGHVSVMHQLKDSYDAATDVEKVHEVDLLHEEISEICQTNEDRIRNIIKGLTLHSANLCL